jgi:hypothetical protein
MMSHYVTKNKSLHKNNEAKLSFISFKYTKMSVYCIEYVISQAFHCTVILEVLTLFSLFTL